MIKKKLIALTVLSFITYTSIVNASYYIPYGQYGLPDMPELKNGRNVYRNAYKGSYWLNEGSSGDYSNGVPQCQYIDHIDVRTDEATVTIDFYENGEYVESKSAIIIDVTNVLINDEPLKYAYMEKRNDGVVGKAEYNFQIVQHPGDKNNNGQIDRDEHDFDFNKWLNLANVNTVTIVVTLRVTNKDGSYVDYKDMKINYVGHSSIVGNSHCTNGSGLDYHLEGHVSHNTIIEIPPTPDPPETPEGPEEEIDFDIPTIAPYIGDNFSANKIWLSLISFLLFIITNIKFKGER